MATANGQDDLARLVDALCRGELTDAQIDRLARRGPEAMRLVILAANARLARSRGVVAASDTPSGMIPVYQKPPASRRRRKPGARNGHAGARRKTPAKIDQHQEHRPVADELEDHFILERQTNFGAFDHTVRVAARAESFTETVADPNQTYGYRIKAVNYAGESAYSPVSVAGPPSAPEEGKELVQQNFLVTFYGADPGSVDSDGNVIFLEEQIHDQLRLDHNYIALGANGRPYRDFAGPTAFSELLAAMDQVAPFGSISQAEITATTVRVVGWSLGAVEAVEFSRQLTDTRGLAGSFFWQSGRHLDAAVPIESMVLLDPVIDGIAPLSMRYIHGPVGTNVQELTNFYQRRGGNSTIRTYLLGTYNSGFPIPVQLNSTYSSQIAGIELRGRPVPVQAGVTARQVRIDTDAQYANLEKVHDYIRQGQHYDGVLFGRDANHSTLVWYQQDEARTLLAP